MVLDPSDITVNGVKGHRRCSRETKRSFALYSVGASEVILLAAPTPGWGVPAKDHPRPCHTLALLSVLLC